MTTDAASRAARARELGLTPAALYMRLYRGWDPADAVATPSRGWGGVRHPRRAADERSHPVEYRAWLRARRRGAVHPAWARDFVAFLAAVGVRPGPRWRLTRAPDRCGALAPGNARWEERRRGA